MAIAIPNLLRDTYRKNKDDIRALICATYPAFVYRSVAAIPAGEIPVFALHGVDLDQFERQVEHVRRNGYITLTSDELYDVLVGNRQPEENSIALTFDDGCRSLWSTVFPLLRKHGLKATAFVISGAVPEAKSTGSTLEDVWSGKASLGDLRDQEQQEPLCNWDELATMQNDGAIDIQSHTSFHSSVFTSEKIIGFVRPESKTGFLTSDFNPMLMRTGKSIWANSVDLGSPIYEYDANMRAKTRFLEDEKLTDFCVNFVRNNGSDRFFLKPGWKSEMLHKVKDYRARFGDQGYYQSDSDREADIRRDLRESKELIESKLGNNVRHLCYPWYLGSEKAARISGNLGFVTNHWGILPGRAVNRVGDDPLAIARIDEEYIHSLPGIGRLSLGAILADKVMRLTVNRVRSRR